MEEEFDDEYYEEYEDEGFGEVFLIEEEPDYDFMFLPKLDIDIDTLLDNYVKLIGKCKTKIEARNLLMDFYIRSQQIARIEDYIDDLQMKVKDINELKEMWGFK